MKKLFPLFLVLLFLFACAPSPEQIEKAIGETQTAIVEAYTDTPVPTETPLPTATPTVTNTPTKSPTKKPTSTPLPKSGTYNNPYPFGDVAFLEMTSNNEKVSFIVQVLEVIRGADAWAIIQRANRFNDAPPTGYEAILIKISIANTDTSGFLSIDHYDVAISTKGNLVNFSLYSPCCIDDEGYVEFDAKLNPGGDHTGWVALAVRTEDKSPLMVLGADYNGRGGLYFSLTK